MLFGDWQTYFSSVKDRTKYAWKNSLFCDVAFTVNSSNGGRQETLQANKYMLAISSPVFQAMFYGELAENNSTIHLPDCTREGLKQMLQFIHSDEIDLTGSNVMEVLYVAEKYMIPSLVKKCKDYLQKSLTPEEVFIILPKCHGDKLLEQHCWELIDGETKQAVFSKPFLGISREMLCHVLERDALKIKELDLFQAVDKWASKRLKEKKLAIDGKNKQDVLGDAIKLIRFPTMDAKDFVEFVLPCGILNNRELTDLFHFFYAISELTRFNSKKRNSNFTSDCRFKYVTPDFMVKLDDPKNAVLFKTDRDVLLVGVRMFGGGATQTNTIDLEIMEVRTRDILSKVSSIFTTENEDTICGYKAFTVTLDTPVKLNACALYKVAAIIEGPKTCVGESGKHVVTVDDPYGKPFELTFRTDKFWNIASSVDRGQFPIFIFRNIEE